MFHLALEYLWIGEAKLRSLNAEASSQITTRGYSTSVAVPSGLSNPDWFLGISDIAYDYCPTNRYLYLKKIERRQLVETWQRHKGYVLDQLIPEIFNEVREYAINTNLRNMQIPKDIKSILKEKISKMKKEFNPEELMNPPEQREIDAFYDSLLKLADYETLVASSFLNYRISNVYSLNVDTEFDILFPLNFKLRIAAPGLGLSAEAEIDFVLTQTILGEIKSQEWFDFYNIGLAAYALAYEFDRKRDVNLGVVICPVFETNRNVPMYRSTANIKIISEAWRKSFVTKRNKRIELIKSGNPPEVPENNTKCGGCGYYPECWPNENTINQA